MERYWYDTCPGCGQGRLFIMTRRDTGQLYLHCEECELGCAQPPNLADPASTFLAIDVLSDPATKEIIDQAGWTPYARHRATDH